MEKHTKCSTGSINVLFSLCFITEMGNINVLFSLCSITEMGTIDTIELEDEHKYITHSITENGVKLEEYERTILGKRYIRIVNEMNRIRQEEPFILYNDAYWASTQSPLTLLRVVCKYADNNVIIIQFESSNKIYIMFESMNSYYTSSIEALRQWYLEPKIHTTHCIGIWVLKECQSSPPDNIYFIIKVTVTELKAVTP